MIETPPASNIHHIMTFIFLFKQDTRKWRRRIQTDVESNDWDSQTYNCIHGKVLVKNCNTTIDENKWQIAQFLMIPLHLSLSSDGDFQSMWWHFQESNFLFQTIHIQVFSFERSSSRRNSKFGSQTSAKMNKPMFFEEQLQLQRLSAANPVAFWSSQSNSAYCNSVYASRMNRWHHHKPSLICISFYLCLCVWMFA